MLSAIWNDFQYTVEETQRLLIMKDSIINVSEACTLYLVHATSSIVRYYHSEAFEL